MTSMVKYASVLTLTAALALMVAAPSQARDWQKGAARNYNGDPSAQSYAYVPAPGYYGPRYFYNSSGDQNVRRCTLSPGSIDFVPCESAP